MDRQADEEVIPMCQFSYAGDKETRVFTNQR